MCLPSDGQHQRAGKIFEQIKRSLVIGCRLEAFNSAVFIQWTCGVLGTRKERVAWLFLPPSVGI